MLTPGNNTRICPDTSNCVGLSGDPPGKGLSEATPTLPVINEEAVMVESAGLLLWRRAGDGVEVLVAHMGGPYWQRKQNGAWGITKGLFDPENEHAHDAAMRETEEELGILPSCATDAEGRVRRDVPLGTVRSRSGKLITVWARQVLDGWDLPEPGRPRSNTFHMQWPPRSGKYQAFPEIDRTAWLSPARARPLMVPSQREFLDRLAKLLERGQI